MASSHPPGYDDADHPPAYQTTHELSIVPIEGALRNVYLVRPNETGPAYFADITHLGGHSVTLHQGTQHGPPIGHSRYSSSGSFKLGVGEKDKGVAWIDFHDQADHYGFTWQGRKYTLRHAQVSDFPGSGLTELEGTQLKVVDEEADKAIVALMICDAETDMGVLKLGSGVKGDAEVMVVLAVLTWNDIIRGSGRRKGGSTAAQNFLPGYR